MNNTTRMFPRTLQEAFPHDPTPWIEHHKPEPRWYSVWFVLSLIGVMLYWVACEYF
jgi:hypothetical protein